MNFPIPAIALALEQWLPRFLEQRRWTGMVRARVKQTGAIHYFDCVLHAIVRDEVVQGISGFARDITRERENETRFTELFQTLREGVYLASADDRITEVNPALAQMLGLREQGRSPPIGGLVALPERGGSRRGTRQAGRAWIPPRPRGHPETQAGWRAKSSRCTRPR